VRIAVASGKGGTGKTTLSVNLASALAGQEPVGLLDCDVEEPNCHLYLKPQFELDEIVEVPVPVIDEDICTGCGLCARACEFHALLALPGVPLLLNELCHSCGVCAFVCPEEAITEEGREVGRAGAGSVGDLYFRWARLDVGEARSTPLIKAAKDLSGAPPLETVIIDAPPGVACPAVETLRSVDFAILVTEPTPFGLHDLKLAVETAKDMQIPCGVVVNRAGIGDDRVRVYCTAENVPILLEIPDDRRIAEACSRGDIYAANDESFAETLRGLAADVRRRVDEAEHSATPALSKAGPR